AMLERLRRMLRKASDDYAIVDKPAATEGWRDSAIADRQRAAFAPLLADLRRGNPRRDFAVAAETIRESAIANPRIVEIGCGTGYYIEVFSILAGPVSYTGVDYSAAMIAGASDD